MKNKNTKLREGDEVIVISGKERGKRGNIKQIVGTKCIERSRSHLRAKTCNNKG